MKNLLRQKKGMGSSAQNVLLALGFAAVTYLIVTIILGIGANLNTTLSTGQTGVAAAVYGNASLGFATWAGYLPTIALVIVAVGVISLLFFAFGGLFKEGSM